MTSQSTCLGQDSTVDFQTQNKSRFPSPARDKDVDGLMHDVLLVRFLGTCGWLLLEAESRLRRTLGLTIPYDSSPKWLQFGTEIKPMPLLYARCRDSIRIPFLNMSKTKEFAA